MVDRDGWAKLSYLTDRIGNRLSGSEALERAVVWAEQQMQADGLANVRVQPVMVPHWVRGNESAELVAPVRRRLAMLGLGHSVGTREDGVTAEVVVVSSFEDLAARAADEVVVLGGHLDSWDVGQGAQDDGSGCIAALQAVALIRQLGLQPRRTIRVVLWTKEEIGADGAPPVCLPPHRVLVFAGEPCWMHNR